MIDYQGFAAVLLEAVKEQQQQIEEQKREIAELKTLVKSLLQNNSGQEK